MDLVETRVARLTGGLADVDEVGELQVMSAANTVGYWDDPAATTATFADGWLRTGDLVRCDADGYYWFEGRAKQIIVRGGSNISPQEVEDALYHHPAVLEAGVIGMPDPEFGEKVMAYVALRPGLDATEVELRALVKSRIADYKTPERIFFLPSLPKGLTGKVQRRELKDWSMAAHDMA
jgi:long-chain acyl-CoA synthetase